MVRVLSERDLVDFGILVREFHASANMRKQHILAVVDDENELTYYEIKVQALPDLGPPVETGHLKGVLAGRYVIIRKVAGMNDVQVQSEPEEYHGETMTGGKSIPSGNRSTEERLGLPSPGPLPGFFGMELDRSRIVLSWLEAVYLMQTGQLSLNREEINVPLPEYMYLIAGSDGEIHEKVVVYGDLKSMGIRRKPVTNSGIIFACIRGINPFRNARACRCSRYDNACQQYFPIGQAVAQRQKEDVVWLCTYYRNSLYRIRPDQVS